MLFGTFNTIAFNTVNIVVIGINSDQLLYYYRFRPVIKL